MNNKKIKKYVITSVISLSVTICLLFALGLTGEGLDAEKVMKIFSDAFSATGIILISVFCLMAVSAQGMFDSLSYIGMVAVRSLVPGMRNGEYQKYGDYKVKKNENRISVKSYLFLLFVGIAFALIGVIFTILFFVV